MINNLTPIEGRFEDNTGNAKRFESIFSNAGAEQNRVYTAEDRRDTMAATSGGPTGLPGWKQMGLN